MSRKSFSESGKGGAKLFSEEGALARIPMHGEEILIGVISDTHNLLRPEAVAALQGVHAILHAGDICTAELLASLAAIAPVYAVRGNNDRGAWADALPEFVTLMVGDHRILMLHDLNEISHHPGTGPASAIVSGHSHRPSVARRDEILYLNPGSAGPRRFSLPTSLAHLRVAHRELRAELIELKV